MKRFEYFEPGTLDEAVALMSRCGPRASLLAGGTDLLVEMKEHVRQPDCVINIKKIRGLDGLSCDRRTGLHFGALVTAREIETCVAVREIYPGHLVWGRSVVRLAGVWRRHGRRHCARCARGQSFAPRLRVSQSLS